MCEMHSNNNGSVGIKTVPVSEAVGTVLSHDITEIIPGEFKGRAFKKGHIVREEDVCHLQRIGKENLFILEMKEDEMHENDAAYAIANALAGNGVKLAGEPNEGKINLVAKIDGLFNVNWEALLDFNMLGEVMCATIHNNSVVKKGQLVAGTRAIPLVVKKAVVEEAVRIATQARKKQSEVTPSLTLPPQACLSGRQGEGQRWGGILEVKEIRKPKAGIVITGNELYNGKIKDAFEPVIREKLKGVDGEIIGVHIAPDDVKIIEDRIRELIEAGADLIITSGGMSVDPDDVTRFAIRNLGVEEMYYGSPVLPGSMFLIAYIKKDSRGQGVKGSGGKAYPSLEYSNPRILEPFQSIPILGIPACGMYAGITVFDLILPRVLAGERIGRKELAELGHGGLCLKCETCRYPVCPFGK